MPRLSCAGGDGAVEVDLPRFDNDIPAADAPRRADARTVAGKLVTTVFDLMLAQYGVARPGLPGQWPAGYDDAGAAVHAGVAGADHRRAGRGGAPGSAASSPTTPNAPAAGR